MINVQILVKDLNLYWGGLCLVSIDVLNDTLVKIKPGKTRSIGFVVPWSGYKIDQLVVVTGSMWFRQSQIDTPSNGTDKSVICMVFFGHE